MAEMPPLIGMSGETSLCHHIVEQTSPPVPAGRITIGIQGSLLSMVIRNRLITNRIDLTAHVQRLAGAVFAAD